MGASRSVAQVGTSRWLLRNPVRTNRSPGCHKPPSSPYTGGGSTELLLKAVSIILLIFGLQLAISPLCLCLGGGFEEQEAAPSCCHAPTPEERSPCPHCDQEMPISATTPANATFDVEAPEWHGFPAAPLIEPIAVLAMHRQDRVSQPPDKGSGPPRPRIRELYGVFLI